MKKTEAWPFGPFCAACFLGATAGWWLVVAMITVGVALWVALRIVE